MQPRTDRYSWQMVAPGQPLERADDAGRPPGADEVLIQIAGCGVCHTDLGFLDGDVKTVAPLPLVLGHEISGQVIEAGPGAEGWLDADVLVPAVIPCGECDLCDGGRSNVCQNQQMPGNGFDGGFATHITVPTTGLSRIDSLPPGHELADMAVIADAVTTPFHAITKADVSEDDFVVVVGAGGVGTYAVQVAAAFGANVVAIDIDDARLEPLLDHGAFAAVNARGLSPRDVRDQVREHASTVGAPRTGWKIFECSGTASGQETAYGLLVPAAILGVVGFTRDKVSIRLSNLMAFDASAIGNWGCPTEMYPGAIELVTSGKIAVLPFTHKVAMSDINEVLAAAHGGSDPRRTILIP